MRDRQIRKMSIYIADNLGYRMPLCHESAGDYYNFIRDQIGQDKGLTLCAMYLMRDWLQRPWWMRV